jgi:uncharacterized protein
MVAHYSSLSQGVVQTARPARAALEPYNEPFRGSPALTPAPAFGPVRTIRVMLQQLPSAVLPAPESATPALAPIAAGERIAAIDVLRGAAVLGILMVNIWSFALPSGVLTDPSLAGGFGGENFLAWAVSHLFFEQKMMSIFSMLFGAGLIVMSERAAARGRSLAGVYYRRIFWLLVLGLVHAYGLWEGDILVTYAICGACLFPCRRLAPGTLIVLGLAVFFAAIPVTLIMGLLLGWARLVAAEPPEEGPHSELREQLHEFYEQMVSETRPEEIDKEITLMSQGSYSEICKERAASTVWEQTVGFLAWSGPRAGGLMLLGMALLKLGVLTGVRSRRYYAGMVLFGLGVGLPLVVWGMHLQMLHQFDLVYNLVFGGHFNYVGSLLVALGYIGLVMLICQAGRLRWVSARLAAVGRMALTNYLSETILCTIFFYGYGFGFFGRLERMALLGVVACVWLYVLVTSTIWLYYFRFGPMEWLWRSLTYWKLQPMWRSP